MPRMKSPISLRELSWLQVLLTCIALAVTGLLWATNARPNIVNVLIYTFCLGNFSTITVSSLVPVCDRRKFPYNWILYLSILLLVTPVSYAIPSLIIYRFVDHPAVKVWDYLLSGWKFPFIINLIFGIVFRFYQRTKDVLETRNRELEKVVEVESSERESHDRELKRAREIQQALLPRVIPQIDGFEVAAAWLPARVVGGDYFDVIPLGGNKLGICIADVVGKSVSAALLMASVQATVRAFATETASPAEVCDRINKVLCNNIGADKFVTMFYGVLDGDCGKLTYCNAGHLEPVLVDAHRNKSSLSGGGLVLGVVSDAMYENASVELPAGARLVLFTDGITEAERLDHEEFGELRVAEIACRHVGSPGEELKAALLREVDGFCGSQLRDDATLIVIAALDTVSSAAFHGHSTLRKRD